MIYKEEMKTQQKLWATGSGGAGWGGGRERSRMRQTDEEEQSKDKAGGKLLASGEPQEFSSQSPIHKESRMYHTQTTGISLLAPDFIIAGSISI